LEQIVAGYNVRLLATNSIILEADDSVAERKSRIEQQLLELKTEAKEQSHKYQDIKSVWVTADDTRMQLILLGSSDVLPNVARALSSVSAPL